MIKVVTTDKFAWGFRYDITVPTNLLGSFNKGDDVTQALASTWLAGVPLDTVAAVAVATGGRARTRIAFLFRTEVEANFWWLNTPYEKSPYEKFCGNPEDLTTKISWHAGWAEFRKEEKMGDGPTANI